MDYLAIARTIQADKQREIEAEARRRRLLAPTDHADHTIWTPVGRTLPTCPCVTTIQRSMVPPAASR